MKRTLKALVVATALLFLGSAVAAPAANAGGSNGMFCC